MMVGSRSDISRRLEAALADMNESMRSALDVGSRAIADMPPDKFEHLASVTRQVISIPLPPDPDALAERLGVSQSAAMDVVSAASVLVYLVAREGFDERDLVDEGVKLGMFSDAVA